MHERSEIVATGWAHPSERVDGARGTIEKGDLVLSVAVGAGSNGAGASDHA